MTWFWLFYLVLIGSCVVFILFLYVLGRWTASAASYAFVLMSVVGVLAAAILLDEQLTLAFALGAVLVLGSVYIGALSHGEMPQKHPEPVPVEEIPDCRKMC